MSIFKLVSVLSGLILEKMYELFRIGTNETVRNIRIINLDSINESII